jgi:hypothetical protein
MAIFDKIGDAVGGAFEGIAGKALESMTGGFNLGDIGNALKGAFNGDFSGLMEVGLTALGTKFLGPHFGPMAADIAMGLINGEKLDTAMLSGVMEKSGILPGSETFGAAMNVFQAIAGGGVDVDRATQMLAGLGVADENLLDLINRIGSGEIDVNSLLTGGGFTGGFAGGRGATDLLTRS